MSNESMTIWVCQCCMLNHANGECGCGAYYGEDPDHDPLGLIESGETVTMGMSGDEHSDDCPRRQYANTGINTSDVECDCETNTFSTSPCGGCGSRLHGERHAMTLWF